MSIGTEPVLWCTLADAKVTYFPMEIEGEKDDEGKPRVRFVRLGISVTMANGDVWFQAKRTGNWTRSWTLGDEEHKDSYTQEKLIQRFGASDLIEALLDGIALAEESAMRG